MLGWLVGEPHESFFSHTPVCVWGPISHILIHILEKQLSHKSISLTLSSLCMYITMFSIIMDPFSRTHLHVIDSQFGIRSQSEHRPRLFFSLTHPEPEMCETSAAQPSPTLSGEIFGFNENSSSPSLKKPSGSITLNFKLGKTQSTHPFVSEGAPC